MVKLSIIIPYYNTFELTCNLIESLKVQLQYGVEIIVIDDGCNEYGLDIYDEDGVITILHKENGGVSSARNKGIELARGEYIAFVDSDDMVMTNYVDELVSLIDRCNEDIIIFNWLDINKSEVNRYPQNCAVWKAIYKKSILPRFDETLKAREDYYFQLELKKHDYSMLYYDKVLYVYNSGREGSLSWKDKRGEL